MVGGIIMTHGDDAGLRLPPRLAPIQVRGRAGRMVEGGWPMAAQCAWAAAGGWRHGGARSRPACLLPQRRLAAS